MKDVCCETCRGALTPAGSGSCPYVEQGKFSTKTCNNHLRTNPQGFRVCRERDFWTFCCNTCSDRFTSPGLDICEYGSVIRISDKGELKGKKCSTIISERGPGVCAVTTGYGLSRPLDQQCCKECTTNPSDGCLYDDGNVPYNKGFLSCADYTAQFGYGECDDPTFRELCCKTCAQTLVQKQAQCASGWTYGFSIDACYMRPSDEKVSFKEAKTICSSSGGTLPMPSSQMETDFWYTLRKGQQWYGLKAVTVGGSLEWQWLDGQPLTWSDWILDPMDPVAEHCGYLTSAGWGRTDCSNTSEEVKLFSCIRPLN